MSSIFASVTVSRQIDVIKTCRILQGIQRQRWQMFRLYCRLMLHCMPILYMRIIYTVFSFMWQSERRNMMEKRTGHIVNTTLSGRNETYIRPQYSDSHELGENVQKLYCRLMYRQSLCVGHECVLFAFANRSNNLSRFTLIFSTVIGSKKKL